MDVVDSATLTGEIEAATVPKAAVRTDAAPAYEPLAGLGYQHESVAHSAGEYARGKVHTNGIESSLLYTPIITAPGSVPSSGGVCR